MNKVNTILISRKYEALLLSLLLLLFGNLVIPERFEEIARIIFLFFNIAIGLIIFRHQTSWKIVITLLLITSFILESLQFFLATVDFSLFLSVFYIFYFILLSFKVYRKIYLTKTVERELIITVFCGFIMLGVMASFVFLIVETLQPGSFTNLGEIEKYKNIQYFSFITTLTVGYGDIVPCSGTAKQLTILFGLIGNFYSVFIVGIVIGKYISNK